MHHFRNKICLESSALKSAYCEYVYLGNFPVLPAKAFYLR